MWSLSKRPLRTPVRCCFCRRALATRVDEVLVPEAARLTAQGAVLMKRVGWFCSRECVGAYEFRFRVILEPEPCSAYEANR